MKFKSKLFKKLVYAVPFYGGRYSYERVKKIYETIERKIPGIDRIDLIFSEGCKLLSLADLVMLSLGYISHPDHPFFKNEDSALISLAYCALYFGCSFFQKVTLERAVEKNKKEIMGKGVWPYDFIDLD